MDITLFEDLGLTENESTIYLTLLKEGELTANEASEKTGLHRSYVYDTLSKMANKGFVSYLIKLGKKHFKGVHPNKFLKMLKEKEEKIQELIPELLKVYKEEKADYNIEILEGKEGLKTFYDTLFDYLFSEDPKEVLQLGRKEPKEEHVVKYYRVKMTKEAEKLGIMKKLKQGKMKARSLLDYSVKKEKRLIKELMPYRYLPKEFDTKGKDLLIVGDKTTIESTEGKPFVIVISNKGITDFFREMFNALWNISEEE